MRPCVQRLPVSYPRGKRYVSVLAHAPRIAIPVGCSIATVGDEERRQAELAYSVQLVGAGEPGGVTMAELRAFPSNTFRYRFLRQSKSYMQYSSQTRCQS